MNKTVAFARLDWMTVKAFWTVKLLLMQLVVFGVVGVATGSPMVIVMMLVMQGAIFSTMPFAVGEQNGIDALYATLPVTRRNVVAGRYLFALCLNVGVALAGTVLSILTAAVVALLPSGSFAFDVTELPQMVAIGLLAVVVVVCVQMPICFRLGYAKSKLIVYLPFVLFSVAVLALNQLMGAQEFTKAAAGAVRWVFAHVALTVLLAVVALAGLLVASAALSCRFYRRREF